MLTSCLKTALLLTFLFALPIFIIRAQPYEDRVSRVLIQENCAAPCFMRIRPGFTPMRDAVYLLRVHDWVSNGREGFSAQVRNAVDWDAALPRTVIGLQWSETAPEWINVTQRGSVTVEDRRVLNMIVETNFLLGEVVLAFGEPDESWYITSSSQYGRRFEYIGWYANQRVLISAEGVCPIWNSYRFPVQVVFQENTPGHSETVSHALVCF